MVSSFDYGMRCRIENYSINHLNKIKMKKNHDQQLVKIKTLVDSNDDDDMTSTSSTSNDDGNDTDRSSKITNLMRENERKIRSLSESYMNRFLSIGQQLQTNNGLTIPLTMRPIISRRPSEMQFEITPSSSSLNSFIETLKQLIINEEKKRGWNFNNFEIFFKSFLFCLTLKKNVIYLQMMILNHQIHIHVSLLELHNVYVIMKQK
jgi:hypothetical protein